MTSATVGDCTKPASLVSRTIDCAYTYSLRAGVANDEESSPLWSPPVSANHIIFRFVELLPFTLLKAVDDLINGLAKYHTALRSVSGCIERIGNIDIWLGSG